MPDCKDLHAPHDGHKNPVAVIQPRLLTETSAAHYISRSKSWLRNTRFADRERSAEGKPPRGPIFIQQGRSIFYDTCDLDAWIDLFRDGKVPPGWEAWKPDTAGLRHQRQKEAV